MLRKIPALLFVLTIIISCNSNKRSASIADNSASLNIEKDSAALALFRQTCYACHSVSTKSHDEIIAPPMAAVKRRYLMSYPEKVDFVNAVVAYAKDPKAEKALMFGAVQQFKPMPFQNFKEEDLRKIASYIYDHEIEKPDWFDAHFAEEHPNGMGMGRSMGRGMGNGRRMMQADSLSK